MNEKQLQINNAVLSMPRDVDILIVEDSPTQAEQLEHIIEERGMTVCCMYNAETALEYLADHIPQIIISDVIMPNMDGFDFCAQIKADKRLIRVPVMLVTALSDPHDIIQGLESGADNFIIKPYDTEYLLSQIEYMIANSRLRAISPNLVHDSSQMAIEIYFGGRKHIIKSSQLQILDILFSTFEVYIQKNKQLEKMNQELAARNERIKLLNGLIPICANCKKVRDDDGYWKNVDHFLEEHSEADFNRSICPECAQKRNID